jgi:adenosylhomocysteine nucleosidase
VTVAVLSALDAEIRELVDALADVSRDEIGGWPTWTGSIGQARIVLAKAGLGKVNTAALAALVWVRYRPELFVFTGVGGGLDPELGIGDVVIGEIVIQHDWGVLAPGGELKRYQAGHVPFFNPTDEYGYTPSPHVIGLMHDVASDTPLSSVLEEPPRVTFGKILTGDQFLQDGEARDRLYQELGAQCVEMEGAALGQVAASVGVDHLVIRAISDLASGESVDDFGRFLPQVASNSARLVLGLLQRL